MLRNPWTRSRPTKLLILRFLEIVNTPNGHGCGVVADPGVDPLESGIDSSAISMRYSPPLSPASAPGLRRSNGGYSEDKRKMLSQGQIERKSSVTPAT